MVVNLFLALENAVGNIAYLGTHGMTDDTLHTVTAKLTVGCYRCRQFGNLVGVTADIAVHVPRQPVMQLVTITY